MGYDIIQGLQYYVMQPRYSSRRARPYQGRVDQLRYLGECIVQVQKLAHSHRVWKYKEASMSPSRDPLQHPGSILLNNIRSSSINIATMALAAEYFSHALSQPYGSSFWVAVAASLVFICYITCDTVYNLCLSPLSSFPGPRLWAVSNIPRQLSILGGRSHLKMLALHHRYGPVVRVGPSELSFNSPQGFRDIYGFRRGQPQFQKDPKMYGSPLTGISNSIGGHVDSDTHSRHRRLLSHSFSERSLREQEGIVVYYVDLFIQRLRERTSVNKIHRAEEDLKSWFNFTTFDIIGDLMFAETFDCLKDSQLHPWIALMFNNVKGIAFLGVLNEYSLFRKMQGALLPKALKQKMLENHKLCAQKADRRLQKGASRPDFVSAILKHGLSDDKEEFIENQPLMSRAEIHANSIFITIAGSETTASLLSGCLFYLCKHKYIMDQLNKEIRTTFSKDEEITSSKCFNLSYLNAVLKESLRLYPPVAASLLRLVPKGGCTIDGHFVPEDVTVSTHHYASYRDAANFTFPEQFIPERWLGTDNRFDSDRKDVVQPFSLGPRDCLGKNLAHMEMRLILSKLLFNFDIHLTPESENWGQQKMFIVWDKPALMVRLTDRFA
ncbi:cytochrome P450 CYP3/CYP5/CYP6/CYP9 subfamily [Aspergillus oryzae 100-8]|nr:cytochrome protein [Aspergillus oryzae 3.042]KDE76188.1 cytochrome P450 CYP3/CYP5/CYP6/CYP9 subfamily [Aspergillus oryzae 100-8]|eukprot:EIT74943.1 cytochrome protein [Aspergillus oryzae 3.042]